MNDYQKVESLSGWSWAISPYGPSFQKALLFVLAHENEYDKAGNVLTEHDPNDSGHATKYGIDAAAHPDLDIENLTLSGAVDSYHRDEWFRARGEQLPEKLAIAHFDGVVNIGEHHSAQILQSALGLAADGEVGPHTIEAANAASPMALETVLMGREAYYRRLRQFPRFGRGWLARVSDLRAYLA